VGGQAGRTRSKRGGGERARNSRAPRVRMRWVCEGAGLKSTVVTGAEAPESSSTDSTHGRRDPTTSAWRPRGGCACSAALRYAVAPQYPGTSSFPSAARCIMPSTWPAQRRSADVLAGTQGDRRGSTRQRAQTQR
jgi:hypothetical protein